MEKLTRAVAAIAAVLTLVAAAPTQTAAPRRAVNVTADSAPGWQPTSALFDLVEKAARDYLTAKDDGRAAVAYRMLTDINQKRVPAQVYSDNLSVFRATAGNNIDHNFIKLTWTKNPPRQLPGIYAALDLVSHYAKIDRHCGYLIFYQAPQGGPFRVMREEETYLDNDAVRTIERQKSRAEVDRMWGELSAHCPNYPRH